MSDAEPRRVKRKGSRRSSSTAPWWRSRKKLALVGLGILLIAANVWVLRRQFPSRARQAAEAYDAGLRAVDMDGDLERAAEQFAACVELEPQRVRARRRLAVVLAQLGRVEEARASIDAAWELATGNPSVALVRAQIERRAGDPAAALKALERVDEPIPAEVSRVRGAIYFELGADARAEQELTAATSGPRPTALGFLSLGDVLLARVERGFGGTRRARAAEAYVSAREMSEKRLSESPGAADAQEILARSLAGQWRAASSEHALLIGDVVKRLEKLVDQGGDGPTPTRLLAEFYRGAGQLLDARRLLETARSKWDQPALHVLAAQVEEEAGELDVALDLLGEAKTAHPDADDIALANCRMLARAGRDAALDACTAAEATFPQNAAFPELRGDLHRRLARAARARGDASADTEHRVAAAGAYAAALELRPRSLALRKKVTAGAVEAAAALVPGAERDAALADALNVVQSDLAANPDDTDSRAWRARLLLLADRAPEVVSELARYALPATEKPLVLVRPYALACLRTRLFDESSACFHAYLTRACRLDTPFREDVRAAAPREWANAVAASILADETNRARALAEKAMSGWPESPRVHVAAARVRIAAGEFAELLTDLEAAAAAGVDANTLLDLRATAMAGLGDVEGALTALRDAGESAAAQLVLADHLARHRRGEEALSVLRRVADRGDASAGVMVRIGALHLAATPPRIAEARAAFERAGADTRAALVRLGELAVVEAAGDASRLDAARAAVASLTGGVADDELADPWALYLRGRLLLVEGAAAESAGMLQRAIDAGLQSPVAQLHLARAHLLAGNVAESAAALTGDGVSSGVDARWTVAADALHLSIALTAIEQGRSADAALQSGAVESEELRPAADAVNAVARAADGAWIEAEAAARGAFAANTAHRGHRLLLATMLIGRGGPDSAREAADLVAPLAASGDDLAAVLTAAAAHLSVEDFEAAAEHLRALEQDLGPLVGELTCLVAAGDLARATDRLGALGSRRGSEGLRQLLRAEMTSGAGADEFAAAVAALGDEPAARLAGAAALAVSGELDAARDALARDGEALSDPTPAWIAAADVALRAGDLDGAEEWLERIRSRDTGGRKHPHVMLLKARVIDARGNAAEALRAYVSAGGAEAYARAGWLALDAGEHRDALQWIDRALELTPDDAVLHNNRATALLGIEKVGDALAAARRARELDASRPEIADTLGWLLVRSGDAESAVVLLEEAAAALATNPTILYHTGVALVRVGRIDDGRSQLERALELDGDFPESAAARTELARLR